MFGKDGAGDAFNIDRVDAAERGAVEIVDSANQLPVMAPARMVVVRRAELLLRAGAAEGGDALEGYLNAPASTTHLVLVGEKPDARLRLTKALMAAGVICEISSPRDQALASYLERQARDLGKKLAPAAAELLVTYANNELAAAAAELEKLVLFAGDRDTISARDVEQAVADRGGALVWSFTDALKARDAQRALDALARYLAGFRRLDEALFPLMGMLRVELRMMIQAKEAAELQRQRGRALVESLAKALGIHPFRVEKAVTAAARFSRRELLSAHGRLLETDRRLKSTNVPARALLDAWVWRFCGKQASAARRASASG